MYITPISAAGKNRELFACPLDMFVRRNYMSEDEFLFFIDINAIIPEPNKNNELGIGTVVTALEKVTDISWTFPG